jgi:phosphonate transport system ATP-binding protein
VQSQTIIDVQNVSKSFGNARVLDGITFSLVRGEMVGLIGASGSGKSTLIRTIAGLTPIDRANGSDCGIHLFGEAMQQDGRIARAAGSLRSRVGVVFQQFNLVPRLSVLMNVCLGLLGRMSVIPATFGYFTPEQKRRAVSALKRVGIAEHALKRGSQLSGGQQQRAAIARTLVQNAEIIIADEPIASLDPSSARRVMDILADLNNRDNITVLVSLHQVEYAMRYCPRTIALKDGRIVYDGPSRALTPEFLNALYGAESEELFLPPIDATSAPARAQDANGLPQIVIAHDQIVAIESQRASANGALRQLNG